MKKKTTPIVGLALTILAVYAILNLVSIKRDLDDAISQSRTLQEEILDAQSDGAELDKEIEAAESDEGIISLAEERLRLSEADNRVFTDIN